MKNDSINDFGSQDHEVTQQGLSVSKLCSSMLENSSLSPLRFNVDFDDSVLSIKWDYKTLSRESQSSFRHMLIIDYSGLRELFQFTMPKELILTYYKLMGFGDFLRVYDLKTDWKMPWIEKSAGNLEERIHPKRHERTLRASPNLKKYWSQTLKDIQKYQEFVAISIVVGKKSLETEQLLHNLAEILQEGDFQGTINISLTGEYDANKYSNIFNFGLPPFLNYDYQKEQFPCMIKGFLTVLTGIRVRSTKVTLKCLNANIQLRSNDDLCWKVDNSSKISAQFKCLSNSTDYTLQLIMDTRVKRVTCFQIQFALTLIDGQKCFTQGNFDLELQPSHKMTVIKPFVRRFTNCGDKTPTEACKNRLGAFRSVVRLAVRDLNFLMQEIDDN